ncbi:MAG: HDOD domain-containing protein [Firmicutes bacterium]|nr:HDOD domain-containing protein [Bacillota bacterium]
MNVFLARQPIFDKNENVLGYEVLYRSGYANVYDGEDGDQATSEVIINTFQTIGIENLSNRKPVFVNFTEKLIRDEVATLIPNDLLVVEILEDVKANKEVLDKCAELKKRGYRIALDDYRGAPGYAPLIELADIVKVSFLGSSHEEIEDILDGLEGAHVKYLAEKVETREEFEYAKEQGFEYFQGYFFSKPEVLRSKKVRPIQSNYLRLIALVSDVEEMDFDKINEIISRDLALTYNLLKLVNSLVFGFRFRIKRTKQALVALGEKEIKKWIYLMILTELGQGKPDELTRLSLIRARFLELISMGTKFKNKSEDLFLTGLFSLLDVILERPLQDILEEIRAPEEIRETLLDEAGEFDEIYKMALYYEKGEWEKAFEFANNLNIEGALIAASYSGALKWYRVLLK